MTVKHPQRRADRLANRLERWESIDPVAARVHDIASKATRQNTFVKNALSGTGLGHAAHPALVVAPLGCWVGALTADLSGDRRAATHLTGAGIVLAIPAVATGASDWTDTAGAEQRVGFIHLVANLTTIALYAASWRARHRNAHKLGTAYGLLGAATATAAGWLGGHLTYNLGVGVDTDSLRRRPHRMDACHARQEQPSRRLGERRAALDRRRRNRALRTRRPLHSPRWPPL